MQDLTKYYGTQRGVEDITFDVNAGEVVGPTARAKPR